MTTEIKEKDRAREQAQSQFESIKDMVERLKSENNEEKETVIEEIQEDPLSVEKKNGYEILLCWGGPACRITGDLDKHNEPETAVLQYQDWGTYWTDFDCDEDILLEYARQFYFEDSK